jgi:hypothetical protein
MMNRMTKAGGAACVVTGLAAGFSGLAAREIHLTPRSDWFAVLQGSGLAPGDEVVLGKGTYTDGRMLSISHRGTQEHPIVIRGEGAVFRRPDARQNSINLVGVQYLVLKDLEITGGAAAIRISRGNGFSAKFVTLEALHIHHVGGVGVTCNHAGNTYEGMHFLKNHIHHTGGHGEGFYLGGNHAKAIFHSSIVELNYIHHLNGPKVSQGDGIELKHGSWGNIVRNNVIHDTKYPAIIVYGTRGKPRNVITGNRIWNTGDQGIQAAADAEITRNKILYPAADGIHSKIHQGAEPGNLLIRDNWVRVRKGSRGLRINKPPKGYSGPVVLDGNRLEHEDGGVAIRVAPGSGLDIRGNRGMGRVEGMQLGVRQWDGSAGLTDVDAEIRHPALK